MLEKINQWLTNPERTYNDGLDLYLKSRSKPDFDKFLTDGKDSKPESVQYNMLYQRLTNIARIMGNGVPVKKEETKPVITTEKEEKPKAGKSKQFPKIDDNPIINASELPDELRAKWDEIQAITPEIHAYHEQAKNATADDDRKELINLAAELEDKKDSLWEAIDTWWKETKLGEGAAPKTEKPQTESEQNKAKAAVLINSRIEDLKTNIARAEKEIVSLSATDEDKLKNAKKIAYRNNNLPTWKQELEEKTAELKALIGE